MNEKLKLFASLKVGDTVKLRMPKGGCWTTKKALIGSTVKITSINKARKEFTAAGWEFTPACIDEIVVEEFKFKVGDKVIFTKMDSFSVSTMKSCVGATGTIRKIDSTNKPRTLAYVCFPHGTCWWITEPSLKLVESESKSKSSQSIVLTPEEIKTIELIRAKMAKVVPVIKKTGKVKVYVKKNSYGGFYASDVEFGSIASQEITFQFAE